VKEHWIHLRLFPLRRLPALAASSRRGPVPESLVGIVRTTDGLGSRCGVSSPDRRAPPVTRPDGASRRRASCRTYTPRSTRPDWSCASRRRPPWRRRGTARPRLAPAPSPSACGGATRGEATLSSIGVAVDVLDRQRIGTGRAVAPAAAAGLPGSPPESRPDGLQAPCSSAGASRASPRPRGRVPVNQPGGAFDFGPRCRSSSTGEVRAAREHLTDRRLAGS